MSKSKTPSKPVKKPESKPKPEVKKAVAKPKTAPKPPPKAKAKPPVKPKAKPAPEPKSVPKAQTKPSSKGKPAAPAKKDISASPKGDASKLPMPKTPKVKAFVIDQKVVYPSQGVGVIKDIVQKKFKDAKIPYYIIYIEVTDMTIMVPVDKAAELGIRPTVSRDEANKALELIKEDYDPIPTDWKLRYQLNLDLLKKGSIKDIAIIVRSLYHRSKVKELPILERKLYDSALKLLIDEASISLRKSKEEIEALVFSRLENE